MFWSIWGHNFTKALTQNLCCILLILVFCVLGLSGGCFGFVCFGMIFVWAFVCLFILVGWIFFSLHETTELTQCAFFIVAAIHLHKVWCCNGGQSLLLNIPKLLLKIPWNFKCGKNNVGVWHNRSTADKKMKILLICKHTLLMCQLFMHWLMSAYLCFTWST